MCASTTKYTALKCQVHVNIQRHLVLHFCIHAISKRCAAVVIRAQVKFDFRAQFIDAARNIACYRVRWSKCGDLVGNCDAAHPNWLDLPRVENNENSLNEIAGSFFPAGSKLERRIAIRATGNFIAECFWANLNKPLPIFLPINFPCSTAITRKPIELGTIRPMWLQY